MSFKTYPVPIEATTTADKAFAPSPVMVNVAPVPVPDVEDCAIVKGPVTFPIVVAAVSAKISSAVINCPVPKAPAAIAKTSVAINPDPVDVTVIPVIVGAVVPVTTTVATAPVPVPSVKATPV